MVGGEMGGDMLSSGCTHDFAYKVSVIAHLPVRGKVEHGSYLSLNLRYLLICMDTTFTKNTGHPFVHEWTSNQRSSRATTMIRLQIVIRAYLVPIKIQNMLNK